MSKPEVYGRKIDQGRPPKEVYLGDGLRSPLRSRE